MATEGWLESSLVTRPDTEQPVTDRTPAINKKGRFGETPVGESELKTELTGDPYSFSFFQAVRLLERLLPGRTRVGVFSDPSEEVARFNVAPFISFPASQIQALEMEDDAPAKVTVNFMGLTGPLGVLPFHYTLLVADQLAARDEALRDFFDIFHHRFISLFYRAWEKNRFTVSYERDQRDRITEHLLDLIGLGPASYRDRLRVPDEALLFYTGMLTTQQRSAVGLQQLLEEHFDVPVEIQQFVGGWYPVSTATQCSLGDETSAASQLGLGAVAGDEIWDQQARVRIKLGPLTREQYDQFLPTGSAYELLRTLARFYSADQFDFELQLILARDEVPGCVVGADEEAAVPLGWSTWIRSVPFTHDADEAILTL